MKINITNIFLAVVILLNLGLLIYVFSSQQDKRAFVDNHKLFEAFEGKLELEKRLKVEDAKTKGQMDSLLTAITTLEQKNNKSEAEIKRLEMYQQSYQQNTQYIQGMQQDKAAKYTEEIWKQINTYMQDFGKEKGYDYIYGVAGLGSLMYGDKTHDITNEAIIYINKKYQGR